MLPTQASHTSQAALNSAALGLAAVNQGGKLSEGADWTLANLPSRIYAYFCDLYQSATANCTVTPTCTPSELSDSSNGMFQEILKAKLDDSGHLSVSSLDKSFSENINFNINNRQFVLQESVDNQGNYSLHFSEGADSIFTDHSAPPANGTKKMVGMSISQFKVACLKEHIRQHREQGQITDLSTFDFRGMDLSGVDFYGTEISRGNMSSIINQGGNLNGACFVEKTKLTPAEIAIYQLAGGKTVEGVHLDSGQDGVKHLKLNSLLIDQNMAHAFIEAGADPQKVFEQYLDTARMRGNRDISLSGFDFNRIKLDGVNLRGVQEREVRAALLTRQQNVFNQVKEVRETSEGPVSPRVLATMENEMEKLHARGIVIKQDDLPDYHTQELGASYVYTSAAEKPGKAIADNYVQLETLAGRTRHDPEAPKVSSRPVLLSGISQKPVGANRDGIAIYRNEKSKPAVRHDSLVNPDWYKKKSVVQGNDKTQSTAVASTGTAPDSQIGTAHRETRLAREPIMPRARPVTTRSTNPSPTGASTKASPASQTGSSGSQLRKQRAAIQHATRPVRPEPLKPDAAKKQDPAQVVSALPKSS